MGNKIKPVSHDHVCVQRTLTRVLVHHGKETQREDIMPNAAEISRFIQARLTQLNEPSVTAVRAACWLDGAGLLRDSRSRRGKPLRELLREGLIVGQRQESNHRWFIDREPSQDPSVTAIQSSHRPAPVNANDALAGAHVPDPTGEVLRDILAEGLRVVFIGTAVGDTSARKQHYYSHPRNSFYHELHLAGLTPRLLAPEEDRTLLQYGIGLTDLIKDAHSSDDAGLDPSTLRAGATPLRQKLRCFRPAWLCFNGKAAYEAFCRRSPSYGQTGDTIEGCQVFIVPSTSGRVSDRQTLEGKTRSEWFCSLGGRLPAA